MKGKGSGSQGRRRHEPTVMQLTEASPSGNQPHPAYFSFHLVFTIGTYARSPFFYGLLPRGLGVVIGCLASGAS